jgi:type I site-specific restriction endonuclease
MKPKPAMKNEKNKLQIRNSTAEFLKILREYHITRGRIESRGRRGKPLIADYVLVYRNRKLAVVEARAWDEELTEGVGQAKCFAGRHGQDFYRISNRVETVPQPVEPTPATDTPPTHPFPG